MKIKYKKVFLALLLASILPSQNACSKAEENGNQKEKTTNCIEHELETKEEATIKKSQKIKIDYKKLESERKKEIVDDFLSYYDNYEPEYYYEDYLLSQNEVKEIVANTTNNKECTFVFDNDIEKLIETIKNNSKEYIIEHPEFSLAFDNKNDNSLSNIFELEFSNALKEIIEKNTNNLNEDFHKMQTLKVFFGDTSIIHKDDDASVLGYYDSEENIIVLSYDNIMIAANQMIEYGLEETSPEDLKFKLNQNFKEVLFFTISHELNHLRQSMCDCRTTNENMGLCYENNIMTILETSAESELYNLNKTSIYDRTAYDYTYFFERRDEALLMLIAMTKNESTLQDYYNAINDTDLESLLNFYGLDNENDIYKFYKVLNIIDGLNLRSNLPYEIYGEESKEKNLEDLKKDIGYGFRNEIFAMALNNLVEYTYENKDFTFEDNIIIFNVLKNAIASDSYTYVEKITEFGEIYDRVYDPSFVTQIIELENSYVEFLAKYYNVSEEEVRSHESSIHMSSLMGSINDNNSDYKKLFERFPLLKAILFNGSVYFEEYNELIDENQELILKKTIN